LMSAMSFWSVNIFTSCVGFQGAIHMNKKGVRDSGRHSKCLRTTLNLDGKKNAPTPLTLEPSTSQPNVVCRGFTHAVPKAPSCRATSCPRSTCPVPRITRHDLAHICTVPRCMQVPRCMHEPIVGTYPLSLRAVDAVDKQSSSPHAGVTSTYLSESGLVGCPYSTSTTTSDLASGGAGVSFSRMRV
jgi:hypothetical protein